MTYIFFDNIKCRYMKIFLIYKSYCQIQYEHFMYISRSLTSLNKSIIILLTVSLHYFKAFDSL